jgi:ribosomal protein S18 acetylase RimI-like enzyme
MTLTTATADDREFLFEVYAASRDAEMAAVPWTEDQKRTFLRMQFEAQDHHYRVHYPKAQFQVIHHEGQPIGRLYVHETADEIRVMDIALLPAWRGAGIGSVLLNDILARAAASNRVVTLHVEHNNPARRLYDRLGFRPASDEGVYLRMEWKLKPSPSGSPGNVGTTSSGFTP